MSSKRKSLPTKISLADSKYTNKPKKAYDHIHEKIEAQQPHIE